MVDYLQWLSDNNTMLHYRLQHKVEHSWEKSVNQYWQYQPFRSLRDKLDRSQKHYISRRFHIRPVVWWKRVAIFSLSVANPAAFLPLQNVVARPSGNGIFAATPTERITHYTLLRKVVCKKGRCPLLIPPQETAVRYHLTERVPPFLVISPPGFIVTGKVSMSCGFISLTMGNSSFPF